jgi:hypothetical protein
MVSWAERKSFTPHSNYPTADTDMVLWMVSGGTGRILSRIDNPPAPDAARKRSQPSCG